MAKDPANRNSVPSIKREQEATMIFQGLALPRSPSLTPWASPRQCGIHVGHTTELDSVLLDIYQASGQGHDESRYQKYDEGSAILHRGPEDHSSQHHILSTFGSIEELVHPYGPFLIQRFRATINSSLLVVEDALFVVHAAHPNGSLDPTLVAAIYSLALATEEGLQLASSSGLDTLKVEETAFRTFSTSLSKPSLSTVQAGIILMQIPHVDSRTLNTQLVGIAYDLGLHEDCSTWMLSGEEQSLRKRLAWAVFVQDKWCSLIHGRPSLISADHWAVRDLVEGDYSTCLGEGQEELDLESIRRGQALFGQMVTLTTILATVLDTFYTLKAVQEAAGARENGTQLILERAKPVQIKLKNWFTQLPPSLKLESNAPGTSSAGKYHSSLSRPRCLSGHRLSTFGILCHRDHPSPMHHPLTQFRRGRSLSLVCLPFCCQNSSHIRHGLYEPASSRTSHLLLVLSVRRQFCSDRHLRKSFAGDCAGAGGSRLLSHASSGIPMDLEREQSMGRVSLLCH